MWLETELVSVSEDGETGWSGGVMSSRWWTLLVLGVDYESDEEAEKQENGIHVGRRVVERKAYQNRSRTGEKRTSKLIEVRMHMLMFAMVAICDAIRMAFGVCRALPTSSDG